MIVIIHTKPVVMIKMGMKVLEFRIITTHEEVLAVGLTAEADLEDNVKLGEVKSKE